MTDKVQKIREEVEKPKTDWLQELQEKLDSLSKEDFEKVMAKYSRYGEEKSVSEDLKTELNRYIKDHFTIDVEQLDRFGIEESDYMYSMDKSDILALVKHFTSWQKQKDSIVSENLEEASKEWLKPQLDKSYVSYGESKMMELTHFNGYDMLDAIECGMNLQREQMMKNAIEGEWWRCAIVLPAKYMNTDDIRSVKIIIIEND